MTVRGRGIPIFNCGVSDECAMFNNAHNVDAEGVEGSSATSGGGAFVFATSQLRIPGTEFFGTHA